MSAQLAALAKHCRREAAADRARLHAAIKKSPHGDYTRLARRLALWLQIADEIDAYLAGDLDQHNDPAQPSLLGGDIP